MLMPRLVRLATEFGGRFLLVMLNTDELGPLARESGCNYAPALQAYQRGDLDQAVTQAAEAALAEPDNPRLAIDLVKLPMLQRRYAQADGLLKSLPDEVREHLEIRDLAAHVGFIRAAQVVPPVEQLELAIRDNPDDLEARYQL